ncbi:NAD(P)/FAD-dependent oxidoreductase [Micromonospora sp. NPDC048830]|uniref:NAD(P)/FAD-dependent oxidoreductase n=1 Tax=Micromonospora sp. NPDC048830 TaxID=3364257 RepID=UPI00371B10DB
MSTRRIVIVGASLAGVSVAAQLRARGDASEIVIVGDEGALPYDRPPLSKQFLDRGHPLPVERTLLRSPQWYQQNRIELWTGASAEALDVAQRVVRLSDGRALPGDEIVVATGARPRQLPEFPPGQRVFYVRTLGDAECFRAFLPARGRLVVVGAGFIGLELAAVAATWGWQVIVLEKSDSPLSRVLPAELGMLCAAPLLRAGVRLLCGAGIVSVRHGDERSAIGLASGELIECDAVVVGVGTVPNVEWLAGSGLADPDGVPCDDRGSTAVPGVWAVGDVARWYNRWTGSQMRTEQWTAAREQAVITGDALSGRPSGSAVPEWSAPPYFWSDLLGVKIQFAGQSPAVAQVLTAHSGGASISFIGDELAPTAVLGIQAPRVMAHARTVLVNDGTWAGARQWLASASLTPQPAVLLPVGPS